MTENAQIGELMLRVKEYNQLRWYHTDNVRCWVIETPFGVFRDVSLLKVLQWAEAQETKLNPNPESLWGDTIEKAMAEAGL